jgi:hypothetical protein
MGSPILKLLAMRREYGDRLFQVEKPIVEICSSDGFNE